MVWESQSGGVESSDEQGSCVLVKRNGWRREVQVMMRLQEVSQEEEESTDMNCAARGWRGFMGVKLDDKQGAVRLHGRGRRGFHLGWNYF